MVNFNGVAQNNIVKTKSSYFDSDREICYVESEGFDSTKPYQLFVILDESTLFDYTTSVLKYISQWKEIPQYIALGIPNDNRWEELQPRNNQIIDDLPFFNFLKKELGLIHCVKNASFRVLVGHSLSARFALQFFFRNTHFYSGIIAISPPLIPELRDEVRQYAEKKATNSYVYICSGDQDLRFHKSFFLELRKSFKQKYYPNIQLDYFKEQPNTSHTLMPITGIKNGVLFMLDDFLNLPAKDMLNLSSKKCVPDSIFEKSYNRISDIYGITPESRTSDIQNFVEVYISKSNFAEAHRLCDLFIELALTGEVYDLIDAYYLKGLVYEKQKDYLSALSFYKKGFSIIPEEVVNKEDFEEDVIRMEKVINHSGNKH